MTFDAAADFRQAVLAEIPMADFTEEVSVQAQVYFEKHPQAHEAVTVGEAVDVSTRLYDLERELNLARSLYDNYQRYLEGTMVEDMTSTANMRMLEEPYVDTERQIWWPAMAGAIALMLLWIAIEFYRLRPPLGARLQEEEHAA